MTLHWFVSEKYFAEISIIVSTSLAERIALLISVSVSARFLPAAESNAAIFTFAVTKLVRIDIRSIMEKVMGYPVMEKFRAK